MDQSLWNFKKKHAISVVGVSVLSKKTKVSIKEDKKIDIDSKYSNLITWVMDLFATWWLFVHIWRLSFSKYNDVDGSYLPSSASQYAERLLCWGGPRILTKLSSIVAEEKNVYWVYVVLFCGLHDAWRPTIGSVFNFFFINQKE